MSDSGWSFVSLQEQHDQQIHNVIKTQEARIQQATGGMLGWARLGASTTRVQIENSNPLPPPPPLLPPSGAIVGPGSTAAGAPTPPKQRDSKKTAAKEFPRTEEGEKAGREPTKGASFGRRLKTSLLGGKKPVLPSNVTEKERPEEAIVIPSTQSPEPEMVLVHPGKETHASSSRPSRQYKPPPVTSQTHPSHSAPGVYSQPSHQPRSSSSTAQSSPTQHERPPSRSRNVPIEVLPAGREEDRYNRDREIPPSDYSTPSGGDTPRASDNQPKIRPLPQPPTVRLVQASTSRTHQDAPTAVVTPVPQPVRPPPENLHPGAYYQAAQPQQSTSSPPVKRYHAPSNRTSSGTTGTTPSLTSSSRTRASLPTSDVMPLSAPPMKAQPQNVPPNVPPQNTQLPKLLPSQDVERTNWATAPPSKSSTASQPTAAHQPAATSQSRATSQPAAPPHRRAASVDHAHSNNAWNDSLDQLASNRTYQPEYHVQIPSGSRSADHSQQITYQPAKLLKRHATSVPATPEVSYYYYDRTPPLISENTRLTDLKEDYRNPGSQRSDIIRRKINYLRFELGYRGLRRARGDGNCFYRSFAFAWLEQIFVAGDRAMAVINALEHLEMAQNFVELAMPENEFSRQMFRFMQDVIRGMELKNVTYKMMVQMFQNRHDSDNIVAYVRFLASAYIRLTPEMHGSVFHPDDPSTVISPPDFCSVYVEQMGQDADHIQISALSRTLNVPVHIYRLDEKIDGIAPHKDDVLADCTQFIPTGFPVATEPVSLLFRPGHYDILEKAGPPT